MTRAVVTPSPLNRWVSLLAGCFLVLVFFGLSKTRPGLRITFLPPLSASSPGELYFWLGHALLLFPASCLLGAALTDVIGPRLIRLRDEIARLGPRDLRLGGLILFLVAISVARVGRSVVLYDFPITDDEYATQFGGYIFATGRAAARLILPADAIPTLGLFYHDGFVSRADWPGAQAVWALGELTRLGPFVWAVLAATPVAALAVLMRHRLGASWGLAAAIIFLCSPMALMLSFTSHAHLGSRAMLAVALTAYWLAERRGNIRLWGLTGLAFGLAFVFRPLETIFFSAPLLAAAAIQTVRRVPGYSRALPGLVVGGIGPVLLMLAHAYAVTGNPFVPPRLDDPAATAQDLITNALWYRFGANVGYNTFMLAIWFLGPLGIALVTVGVMTDRFTRLLGLGVVTGLGLALLHTNMGLHSVGPIHYSELAVPLTIIAVHGLANLLRAARAHRFDPLRIASAVAIALLLGLGIFNVKHAAALQEQAGIQAAIYDWVERSRPESQGPKVVVLAPQFGSTWLHLPGMVQVGTWVFEWRRPHPDLRDDLVILRDVPGLEDTIRERFPDRRFFRLVLVVGPPFAALVPLGAPPQTPMLPFGVPPAADPSGRTRNRF
jgi:dolichyl-phosphate-mannose-protein mannosyltransferase